MKTFDEIVKDRHLTMINKKLDGFSATITTSTWSGSLICSKGAGWEHVSVSPWNKRVTPSWDNMCMVKDIFWNDDEGVIQIYPPKDDYVNNMPNCLHLWRCTYKRNGSPSVGSGRNEEGADNAGAD